MDKWRDAGPLITPYYFICLITYRGKLWKMTGNKAKSTAVMENTSTNNEGTHSTVLNYTAGHLIKVLLELDPSHTFNQLCPAVTAKSTSYKNCCVCVKDVVALHSLCKYIHSLMYSMQTLTSFQHFGLSPFVPHTNTLS